MAVPSQISKIIVTWWRRTLQSLHSMWFVFHLTSFFAGTQKSCQLLQFHHLDRRLLWISKSFLVPPASLLVGRALRDNQCYRSHGLPSAWFFSFFLLLQAWALYVFSIIICYRGNHFVIYHARLLVLSLFVCITLQFCKQLIVPVQHIHWESIWALRIVRHLVPVVLMARSEAFISNLIGMERSCPINSTIPHAIHFSLQAFVPAYCSWKKHSRRW